MKIENYTPHNINILKNNEIAVYPSLGNARCTCQKEYLYSIDGIEVYKMVYGDVEGLPKPMDNTIYIVSKIVKEALKDRDDLLIVNEVVKDENNQILYCKSLSKM